MAAVLALAALAAQGLFESLFEPLRRSEATSKKASILVVYSGPTDPPNEMKPRSALYHRNLQHFLMYGVSGHHRHVTTAVVITNATKALLEPVLRKHDGLQVYYRRNVCYDMESYRIVLDDMAKKGRAFKYYIMLNCGLFGPSLPAYLQYPHAPHWADLVTSHITKTTKLVGMYVCGEQPGGLGVLSRFKWPGVASEFWATDAEGLSFIQGDKVIFKCSQGVEGPPSPEVYETELCIRYEMGLSRAMLSRGYNLAGLNVMQHGIDWRLPGQGGKPPPGLADAGSYYGGSTPSPLDFLFLKMTRPPPKGDNGPAELHHLRHLMPLYDPETRDDAAFHMQYGARVYRSYDLERREHFLKMKSRLETNMTGIGDLIEKHSWRGMDEYLRIKDGWRPHPKGR